MQQRVRLYANNCHLTDDKFDRYEPLVRQPNTHQGKIFLACLATSLGLFLFGVITERDWLAGTMALATPIIPFVVLYLRGRGVPADKIEAYAVQRGLLLIFECGQFSELSAEILIPFTEITSIVLESKVVYEGRLGPHRWRQYRISTSRSGETPHLLINTFRPMHLVLQDLQRLSALSGAHQIDMQLIGQPEELAALRTH
ncbi:MULTISPECIES: hypothetical protein [Pseudomonadaceae]|uniref:hypothetical protein n=1 Tax=Pseudomonadaceae TaxID=135621 RepID=UPI001CA38BFB|nr:hypothetical protein [Pseudomonas sp. DNDY-54]